MHDVHHPQQQLRVGTSRFLSQGVFVIYKLVLATYYLFWAVYWPEVEGFTKQAANQLTFWTWDACSGYFLVSTFTASLCWQASKIREGPTTPFTTPAATPSASATTTATTTPTTAASPEPVVRDYGDWSPLPWGLRWLQLILWNIACVASLLVTLVWATEDYLRQVQQGVTNFDVQAHGLIAFFMLVDQMLIADQFKLKHVVITQVYGMVYLTFSIFWFYMAPEDEKYLYQDILDWEDNRVSACIWGALAIGFVAPVAALVHVLIYRVREAIYGRIETKSSMAATKSRASSRAKVEAFDATNNPMHIIV